MCAQFMFIFAFSRTLKTFGITSNLKCEMTPRGI